MTETTMQVLHTINAVDGFNPAEFTRNLSNEDGGTSLYLDVKYRLLWFRLHRPQGKISSEIVSVTEKSAIVTCRLYADRSDPPSPPRRDLPRMTSMGIGTWRSRRRRQSAAYWRRQATARSSAAQLICSPELSPTLLSTP